MKIKLLFKKKHYIFKIIFFNINKNKYRIEGGKILTKVSTMAHVYFEPPKAGFYVNMRLNNILIF